MSSMICLHIIQPGDPVATASRDPRQRLTASMQGSNDTSTGSYESPCVAEKLASYRLPENPGGVIIFIPPRLVVSTDPNRTAVGPFQTYEKKRANQIRAKDQKEKKYHSRMQIVTKHRVSSKETNADGYTEKSNEWI